ncbi:MAG: phosphoenolpyruvate carboxykinase (ATP) [Patescibacteria group bacterium]|nr:phosphoenolpyruvate carboxykinase (ATP) [Patescibacteria group bacterium]
MKSGKNIIRNLSVSALAKKALENHEVIQSKTGALIVYTGKFTGRSPKDKYIVDTPKIHNKINWGPHNQPISEKSFELLYHKIINFLNTQKEVYVVDSIVSASEKYSLKLRGYFQYAHQALFASYMFRNLDKNQLKNFSPDLTLYAFPSVYADPSIEATKSEIFIILNLEKKIILIGGTKYLGEIKKSVFTFTNYYLPENGVFSMHCSANTDIYEKESALFFGLSGTGKTTLSADISRKLIGDDEHALSNEGIFNLEGGCYAKCIGLKKESEPQIWKAVNRKNALLENVVIDNQGNIDFEDSRHTENTRAAYPLSFIENSIASGIGPHPKYIIFLTADAQGVMPPIAKLNLNQACYHFLSGYTSKLAGTERGIKEPQPTFSAYFGAPFMPLKPMVYLNLLKKYLKKYEIKVFLINTGWIGGKYAVGKRISIEETRNIVSAILLGKLDNTPCQYNKIFNLYVPEFVPEINQNILDPSFSWTNKNQYQQEAKKLAFLFNENIKKYQGLVLDSIINSGPKP